MDTDKLIHAELSEAIIGSAMKVLNTLKSGLNEKTYENAMVIELKKRGHRVDQQKHFDILDDGQIIDPLVPDLVVDESVIVDLKVADDFTPTHVAQMIGYLAITQLRLTLLLNFKHSDLRWRRVVG